jgi:ribosomal protein L37AE/L43A
LLDGGILALVGFAVEGRRVDMHVDDRVTEYADEGSEYAVCPLCGEERPEYEWVCDECRDEQQGDDSHE